MPDTADLSSPPAREGVAFRPVRDDELAGETAALHNTHEAPPDTNDQEFPTRKL